jgi:asparagine synthase (glutamine-hydrolysing)
VCGLTGYLSRRASEIPQLRESLPAAVRALHHRGPDDQGVWFGADNTVGLGHARLSILDLSAHGHQPMVSPDGRLAMVFNGEVYNYRDIRRELEPFGHAFSGTGDSEVILAAFRQWGVQAVNRFIGMFAIALWDMQERRLTLLRDRLGVKPLYYGWDGNTLWFGSELKALRAFRHWRAETDPAALAEYFQFGHINAPRSIYRKVSKLPPGHWLELGPQGEPVVRRFWSVLDALHTPLTGSEDELTEQLETLLIDAFRLRMVSDVPVGMFLSGGIDSSLVTALLQKHHGNIHTFTIGFNEAQSNEAPHARRVAEHLGTNHTERILETDEAKRILPHWGDLYDEPFQDSSGIPTYLVSKVASEQVKVVLSADGGDELFSGYNVYERALIHVARRASIPAVLRHAVVAAGNILPLDHIDEAIALSPLPRSVIKFLRAKLTWRACRIYEYLSAPTSGAMYEQAFTFWDPRTIRGLTGAYERVRETSDVYPGSFAEQMCLWDLHNYLPGDILAKVDRATMAVSIEGREPLIDHRIAEFAFRLPLSLRRGPLGPKHILRKILYRHVPRNILDRPKMGFGIPLLEWLRGDLAHLLGEHLNRADILAQGVLDPAIVERTVRAFKRGDDYAVNRVWTLLAFQMWRQKWG